MKKNKAKKIFIPIATAILILFAVLALVYGFSFSDPASQSLKKVFPATMVGSKIIPVYYYEQALSSFSKFDSKQSSKDVMKKLIRDAKIRNLSRKRWMEYPPYYPTVDEELAYYKKNNKETYDNFLQKYFSGSEQNFKSLIVEPNANDARLRIIYYSMQENSSKYIKAKQLLARIKSGEKFEDIAKEESEDKQSAQFGGDLGFSSSGDFIPELDQAIMAIPVAKVYDQVVVSRHGYHILYTVETAEKGGEKFWHAKHILIKGEGFDSWLNSQLSKIGSWTIIK